VIRRLARRRGGVRVVTIGYVLVGGSSFLLLAAGPRLLGTVSFSGLGLIWTVSTLFGIGVALPTEQLVGRRMNVGTPDPVSVPIRWLLALGMLAGGLCWLAGSRSAAADALPALVPGMLLAVAGWIALAVVRGRIAGSGDLTIYGGVLGVESATRVILVVVAAVHPAWSLDLLPLAVGLPLVFAALAGSLVRVPLESPRRGATAPAASEQLSFVLVAVGFQVCLNGAPLLLEWRSGSTAPAAVGAFVAASTYFRAPSLLVGGISTHAIVELSHAWGAMDLVRFRTARSAAMRQVFWLLGLSCFLMTVLAPIALHAYYGAKVDLPLTVLLALPLSTVIAVTAAIAVQPLLAAGHGGAAGALWLAGACVTCLFLAVSSELDDWTGVALVAGPTLTLIGALVQDNRLTALHQAPAH
jgi:hypothetical protein